MVENLVLVITSPARMQSVTAESLRSLPGRHKICGIGLLQPEGGNALPAEGPIPVVAVNGEIAPYILRSAVDAVMLDVPPEQASAILDACCAMNVAVYGRQDSENPVLLHGPRTAPLFARCMKRALDILGSLVGLLFTGLAFLIFAPLIRRKSPGPVFFSQERVGRGGRRFTLYKFRTMCVDAEAQKAALQPQNKMRGLLFKVDHDPRVIPGVGAFLRKTGIDELPQMWNVLRGEMSLVGTRPPTVDEFERYEYRHKSRLSAKPGITGLWQVSGKNKITDFEEVVKLDNAYISGWSLALDVKILLKTVPAVLGCRETAQ